MANIREIKVRIKAVKNIQRITKTMQMIATAKLQAAMRKATAGKPYTEKIAELVGELAAAAGEGEGSVSNPLLQKPENKTGKTIVLTLAANRGLCGGYNGNILRELQRQWREAEPGSLEVEAVGRKAVSFFNYNKIDLAKHYDELSDEPEFDEIQPIAESLMERFIAGEVDEVKVVYMKFLSRGKQVPVVETLLPMQPPEAKEDDASSKADVEYDFSPEPEELLAELLPLSFKAYLYQCFKDAKVSEHIARMMAMKAATDNASEMGKSLKRQFNRARQAKITTELIEIISASEALG